MLRQIDRRFIRPGDQYIQTLGTRIVLERDERVVYSLPDLSYCHYIGFKI
jgi:hypothetical protein